MFSEMFSMTRWSLKRSTNDTVVMLYTAPKKTTTSQRSKLVKRWNLPLQ